MKRLFFICLSMSFSGVALALFQGIQMPLVGKVLNENKEKEVATYTLQSNSTKAYSPIDGTVFYVGNVKDYGLSVIIKNAHQVVILGNLDRVYAVKNQYLFQHDAVGSVVYHSKVIFVVEQIQRKSEEYGSVHLAENFRNKLLNFAKNGSKLVNDMTRTAVAKGSLTYHDLTRLLKETGFPEKTIPTMYCIAKWESGLNPKALNYNTNNTIDVGLFQINSLWFKKCNMDLAALYNEKDNTQCALTVYKNQGFPAWTTYNKYKNNEISNYCRLSF